ncbi:TIGR04086 family membrane protein [Heyndrickxia ginsengihumi]|uniref:Membrane protein n=1 Tax=Heyndrickxia ginsengihumi TaxID=363870 RepID=A0A0A6VHH5_9BACI|nr:TIGR04086 family membrane protein [Heyndrickxia ginsengihumi]KHD86858.1 membrane protein [Heyndrickxia ginsengihumi]MBE6184808.1 TIGR04086 family membrane protein [Bacillus sp. (in: firmicutes)]MCM3021859.1 TIGR04086 family membrane protein [Heyndrickxia ginsengihumi]NEY20454.1 TIGR04086 family membrane protein [Heyndrickxia ginsengihumi]
MTIETRKLGMSIVYGIITIFVLLSISSLIISLILRFTDVTENSISIIVTVISFITLFIGGFICGGRGKKKGWLLGSLTGIIYTFIVFLVQYLGYDELFSLQQIIYHICYIATATMGGILGVNLTSGNSREA